MSVSMSWTAGDSGRSRIAVIWLIQPRNVQLGTSKDYNSNNNNNNNSKFNNNKKRNEVIRRHWGWHALLTKYERPDWDGMSCDEKRGPKLHEKNYGSRGQRTPQSRTTEEAMGKHENNKTWSFYGWRRKYWRQKEVERKDLSSWPLPWEGLIQARRIKLTVIISSSNNNSWNTAYLVYKGTWEKQAIFISANPSLFIPKTLLPSLARLTAESWRILASKNKFLFLQII